VTQNQTTQASKLQLNYFVLRTVLAISNHRIPHHPQISSIAPGSPRNPNLSPLGGSIHPPTPNPILGNFGDSSDTGQSYRFPRHQRRRWNQKFEYERTEAVKAKSLYSIATTVCLAAISNNFAWRVIILWSGAYPGVSQSQIPMRFCVSSPLQLATSVLFFRIFPLKPPFLHRLSFRPITSTLAHLPEAPSPFLFS
jgi:hypothetical protein